MRNRTQLNWLQKLWFDLTTNPATGKYSQKRFMMWGWFGITMYMGFTSAVTIKTNPVFDIDTRPVEPVIIALFIVAALGASVATIMGFWFNRKTADDNGHPLEPASHEPLKNENNEQ